MEEEAAARVQAAAAAGESAAQAAASSQAASLEQRHSAQLQQLDAHRAALTRELADALAHFRCVPCSGPQERAGWAGRRPGALLACALLQLMRSREAGAYVARA